MHSLIPRRGLSTDFRYTTAFGLVVAMIIQTFQNLFVSRIDKLVLEMEEQSVKILDYLYEAETKK